MKTVYLDFRFFANAQEVHSFLKSILDFPPYYGMNLDALYDCLTDLSEETRVFYRRGGHRFEHGFLAVMEDAAEANAHFTAEEED